MSDELCEIPGCGRPATTIEQRSTMIHSYMIPYGPSYYFCEYHAHHREAWLKQDFLDGSRRWVQIAPEPYLADLSLLQTKTPSG